ncbi:hypothetical protein C8N35_101197 [Breoghania corrubedonensis]|uniref:Uncharacterized protein n=1 Tax=Breoghania corrubedonensis TaxID=665038 RepID=A0A2T5VEH9_9HYPH|nr:hypothetical protein [Breoghania corrubedonensis]PTW62160.1 hypothetical protein C8N35_101197 [Breoghania corrubedonensis]
MSKEANDNQQDADQKPDLDKLYKPVGIQAISAATVCFKEMEQRKKAAKRGY